MCAALIATAIIGFYDPVTPSLIRDLGSRSFERRIQAEARLEQIAGPAVSRLQVARRSADPEIARRADSILTKLQRRWENERLLTPTLIDLPLDLRSVTEVITELQAQSGYRIRVPNDSQLRRQIQIGAPGKVPFWQILEPLLVQNAWEIETVGNRSLSPNRLANRESSTNANWDYSEWMDRLVLRRAEMVELYRRQWERSMDDEYRARKLVELRREEQRLILELPSAVNRALDRLMVGTQAEPDESGSIQLIVNRSKNTRTMISGGLRIQVSPLPSNQCLVVPANQRAILISVMAEPKLRWERLTGVLVRRATDNDGQELKVAPLAGEGGAQVMLSMAGRRLLISNDNSCQVLDGEEIEPLGLFAPHQAMIRLIGTSESESLRDLSGVIQGQFRDEPQELAVLAVAGKTSGVGHEGLRINVTEVLDDSGKAALDIAVQYSPSVVHPAAGFLTDNPAEFTVAVNATETGRRRFGPALWGGEGFDPAIRRGDRAAANGIRVTDANNRPMRITVKAVSRTLDRATRRVTDRFRAWPEKTEQAGKPAKVALWGSLTRTIEVPFAFDDIMTALGKADATP